MVCCFYFSVGCSGSRGPSITSTIYVAVLCICIAGVLAQPTLNPDYEMVINITSPRSAFAARDAHSSIVLNGRAYVCGGINRVTQMVFQDVWVSSSPNSGVWVPVAVLAPYPRRFDHGAAVVGSTLIVMGGDFFYGAVSSSRHDVWASNDNGVTTFGWRVIPKPHVHSMFCCTLAFGGSRRSDPVWSLSPFC
jgi:hypothetical protein